MVWKVDLTWSVLGGIPVQNLLRESQYKTIRELCVWTVLLVFAMATQRFVFVNLDMYKSVNCLISIRLLALYLTVINVCRVMYGMTVCLLCT